MPDRETMMAALQRSTDEELLSMLTHPDDFEPEACSIAKALLAARGVSAHVDLVQSDDSGPRKQSGRRAGSHGLPWTSPVVGGLMGVLLNLVGAAVLGGALLAAGSSCAPPGRVFRFVVGFLTAAFMAPVALISGQEIHSIFWVPSVFLFTGAACVLLGVLFRWLPLRILGHVIITIMFLVPALFFAANLGEFVD